MFIKIYYFITTSISSIFCQFYFLRLPILVMMWSLSSHHEPCYMFFLCVFLFSNESLIFLVVATHEGVNKTWFILMLQFAKELANISWFL
jgi:hypothetical protein